MALRHQQSSLAWWGAGWGHWGDNPKAALPARHWLATGERAFLRAGSWPRRAGCGYRGGIPVLDALCSHHPAVGDTALPMSPWLRGPGWGHGGGTPRAGPLVQPCPPVGDAAPLRQSSLPWPGSVPAALHSLLCSWSLLPAARLPSWGQCGAHRGHSRGTGVAGVQQQGWHHWVRLCKPPLQANRAQGVPALSRDTGSHSSASCCQHLFPGLGMVLAWE